MRNSQLCVARAHRLVQPGPDLLPVVAQHEVEEGVEARLEARPVEAEDAEQLRRPMHRLAADRPAPVAEAGEPLDLLELLLALEQRGLDALPLGDLGERLAPGAQQLELRDHQMREVLEQPLVLRRARDWLSNTQSAPRLWPSGPRSGAPA